MIKLSQKLESGSVAERRVIVRASVLAGVLLLVDQASKILIERNIRFGCRLSVIPGFFDLTHITNKGAAWGILQGYGWLLLIIGGCVILMMLCGARWLAEGYVERYFALLLIVAGIVGNSIDRIWRGEVVDFLDFYIGARHWPAFNAADSAICVGVAIFFISAFLRAPARPLNRQCAGGGSHTGIGGSGQKDTTDL